MDHITIEKLKIFAHHGVFEHETVNGQNFYVNAKLYLDTEYAGISDDLDRSVDYGQVCRLIETVMTRRNYQLIEAAAQAIAAAILQEYALVQSVEIELCKPEAPIGMEFGSVSVTIRRAWHTALIALGSNMGDSRRLIGDALETLRASEYIKELRSSSLIVTKPYGYTEQADFLNGAALCRTLLSPQALLRLLQSVEQNAGRVRDIHWGPRTLDLDLIFYDDAVIRTPTLTVPHPDMHNRDFVLRPASELMPEYVHPVLDETVQQLLERLETNAVHDRGV